MKSLISSSSYLFPDFLFSVVFNIKHWDAYFDWMLNIKLTT